MIELAAVEDYRLLVDGLRAWIQTQPDLHLAAVTATVDGLLQAPSREYDVVLLNPLLRADPDPAVNTCAGSGSARHHVSWCSDDRGYASVPDIIGSDEGHSVCVLFGRCRTVGGSPRAIRAWPLAWPSPSGPPGRQRSPRARVGPEDAFCGAIFAERLERIFGCPCGWRGRHGQCAAFRPADCDFHPATGVPSATMTAWSCSCGAVTGAVDGGDRLRPVAGEAVRGSRRGRRARVRRTRRSCRPATARPRRPGRLPSVTRPLCSPPGARA